MEDLAEINNLAGLFQNIVKDCKVSQTQEFFIYLLWINPYKILIFLFFLVNKSKTFLSELNPVTNLLKVSDDQRYKYDPRS